MTTRQVEGEELTIPMSRDDAALLRLKKLESMAECGTVDSWMKLSDDQKRMWFALCVDESSRRKKAEDEIERLREESLKHQAALFRCTKENRRLSVLLMTPEESLDEFLRRKDGGP